MQTFTATEIIGSIWEIFQKLFDIEIVQGLLMISISATIIVIVFGIVKIGRK